MNEQVVACPACKAEVGGKYCNQCSESLHPNRFSLKYIISTIPNIFMGVEEGLYFTTKHLLFYPAQTITAYLNGDRNRYTQPFKYLLFMCGIYALLFNWKTIAGTETESMFAFYSQDPAVVKFLDEQYTASQSLLNIALLPLLSCMSWLVFQSKKLYFGEHLYMNSFIIGFIMFINNILFPIMLLLNGTVWVDHILSIISLLTVFIVMRVYIGMFYQPTFAGRAKGAVVSFLIVFIALLWFMFTAPFFLYLKVGLFGE